MKMTFDELKQLGELTCKFWDEFKYDLMWNKNAISDGKKALEIAQKEGRDIYSVIEILHAGSKGIKISENAEKEVEKLENPKKAFETARILLTYYTLDSVATDIYCHKIKNKW